MTWIFWKPVNPDQVTVISRGQKDIFKPATSWHNQKGFLCPTHLNVVFIFKKYCLENLQISASFLARDLGAAGGGGGGMANADHCWRGQKFFQKREIMGTENVDKEDNWFKYNCIS